MLRKCSVRGFEGFLLSKTLFEVQQSLKFRPYFSTLLSYNLFMPEWLGKTIGNVRVERLLARGGMAEVYLGTHLNLERPVAIKLLHSYVEEEPVLLERFHREAKIVAGLRHPNIVGLFDFDTVQGHPYIVMEYLSGPTLETYLRHLHQRKKRISPEQIVGLLNGLSNALDYAHREGVIHRDIKPGNIMLHSKTAEIPLDQPLAKDVQAILTDFGLVRVVNTVSQTASGFFSGTPAYMSPEQARGDQIDQRTDLYSLGIVLYEMLAGSIPFEADNTVTVLHMHIHTPPPPVPGISPEVQVVLDRALAKKPDDRYQTSHEMANEFYRALGMATKPEVIREPYSLKPEPTEIPPSIKPEVLPVERRRTEAEPPPGTKPQQELGPPAKSKIQSDPEPSQKPVPIPKRSRSLIWIGLGIFSLVCLLALVFGVSRLFAVRALFPPPPETQSAVLPNTSVTPTTSINPIPTGTVQLPAADRMVLITGGTYKVGTTNFTDQYHAPPTTVELGDFWIDQFQTTNAEYKQYLKATGVPNPIVWPGQPDHPVTGVTWDQALAYCQWKQKRLSTEAEWEAAGRGPGAEPPPYPWGNDPTADGQTLSLPNDDTYAVGSLSYNKSSSGVFDMVGNIWEWVGEAYISGQENFKILRGGRYGLLLDLSYRLPVAPDDTRYLKYAGFRCAADQVR
jgi:serine/threonine protein kinase